MSDPFREIETFENGRYKGAIGKSESGKVEEME
jgi:hypothetical protein